MLRSAVLASLVSLAAAQNQTISWFFPGAEGVDLVASIVSANPSTTVALMNCPTSADSSDCGFGPGVSVSIISSTIYQAVMSESDFFMSASCVYKTSEMPCSVSIGGSGANDPGTSVETFSGSDIAVLTATITAGAEKLSASASASATGQSSGMTTSASAGAKSASHSGATSTSSGKASGTGTAASASGTGAAYRFGVEGSAMLALAGAAVVAAL